MKREIRKGKESTKQLKQIEKQEQVENLKTSISNNYKFFLIFFMIFILINLPIAISYSISEYDKSYEQGKINIPPSSDSSSPSTQDSNFNPITGFAVNNASNATARNVGEKCSEKGERVSSFVKFMDNGIISTMEKIASIMFMISTVASAIDTIINTVYTAAGCCNVGWIIPGWNAVCGYKEIEGRSFQGWFTPFVRPLACFVNCGWCTGDTSECFGGVGKFFGTIGVAGKIPNFVKSPTPPPEVTGTTKQPTGIGQFHLSPYENIYTAIGCACPIAILFNLRKLKAIYQVYDCCIGQACRNGLSTEACENQLSEATCMYWKGSFLKMLVKIILSILTSIIYKTVIDMIAKVIAKSVIYCVLALWDLVEVPSEINAIKSSWEWMSQSFKDPSCEDLGFKDVKKNLESGVWSSSEGISKLTLNDVNGDGRYDTVKKSYDKKKIKLSDLPNDNLKNDLNFKNAKNIYEYDLTINGKKEVYYGADKGVLDKGVIYSSDNKFVKAEDWKSILKSSNPTIQGPSGMYTNGKFYPYTVNKDGTITWTVDGKTQSVKLGDSGYSVYGLDSAKFKQDPTSKQWTYDGRAAKIENGYVELESISTSSFEDGVYEYGLIGSSDSISPEPYWGVYGTMSDKSIWFRVNSVSGKLEYFGNDLIWWDADPAFQDSLFIDTKRIKSSITSTQSTKIVTSSGTFTSTGENDIYQFQSSTGAKTLDKVKILDITSENLNKLSQIMSSVPQTEFENIQGASFDGYSRELTYTKEGKSYTLYPQLVGGKNIAIIRGEESKVYVDGKKIEGITITDQDIGVAQEAYAKSVLGKDAKHFAGNIWDIGEQGSIGYKSVKMDPVYGGVESMERFDGKWITTYIINTGLINKISLEFSDGKPSVTLNYDEKSRKLYYQNGNNYYYYDNGKWYGADGKEIPDKNIPAELKDKDLISRIKKSTENNKLGATFAEREINDKLNKFYLERAGYELTWKLLNEILGKFAYKAIDESCKKETNQ